MFFYLYDSFVLDKNYSNTLNRIESRIIELGINGRVEKLTPLRNLKEVLERGLEDEAHTVVVVGSDATLVRVINIVAPHNVVIGFIPLQPDSKLGKVFGITDPLEACDILSRRITKTLPLLKVNQNYALTALTAQVTPQTKIRCDDAFTLHPTTEQADLKIFNLGEIFTQTADSLQLMANPTSCRLSLAPIAATSRWISFGGKKTITPTTCNVQKITIDCSENSLPVQLDNAITLKTPVTIQLKPKLLKLIVGKSRMI